MRVQRYQLLHIFKAKEWDKEVKAEDIYCGFITCGNDLTGHQGTYLELQLTGCR